MLDDRRVRVPDRMSVFTRHRVWSHWADTLAGQWLRGEKIASQKELDALESAVEELVEKAIQFADESPFPEPSALYEDVYGE